MQIHVQKDHSSEKSVQLFHNQEGFKLERTRKEHSRDLRLAYSSHERKHLRDSMY